MSFRHALATAAAVIALAPASAFAQGAGDDQYADPFGDEQAATPTPAPRRPAATATPAPARPAQTATPAPAQQPQSTPDPGNTLPYTGVDAWPLALGGVLLLGTGLALRARITLERQD